MKNFLIAFAVFLVWSFFGLWLYSWLQPQRIGEVAKTEIAENNVTDTDTNAMETGDSIENIEAKGDSIILTKKNTEIKGSNSVLKVVGPSDEIIFLFPEGITVFRNSAEVYIPQSSLDFKYKLNTYLMEHPDQELHIASIYSASENIESPNYGVQRGNKVKRMLEDIGIPGSKLVVKPIIKEIEFSAQGSYDNSISFAFKPLDEARIEAEKKRIPEAKIIYPKFSSSGILVNEPLQELLDEVIAITREKPDITVEVIGHTDNIGNDTDNFIAGLEYARQVRWYLITKGKLDRNQILASSKGEADPIESNNTAKGRNLNRRIEVKFY